ncbi:TVP38/TMEM64 family protein [Halomonas halocynthiae]|uniref:TVP38/TMEM64 family protein n=1 Tax=Halomonas halocynthiae TaxID=176290 RepID=UPI000410CD6D|nr:VTT domain-containing protein [Halomonas halocynthiae]
MSRSVGRLLIFITTLLSFGLLWQWLAMQNHLDVDTLLALTKDSQHWKDSPLVVLIIMAAYAAASLVMFPLSLMVALTGLLFGPWWGFGYALAGTLSASMLNWWIGRLIGRDALLRHGGQRLTKLSRYLSGRGVRTMVIINLLPLAPFTLTNMMAGAFHLRFRDYMVGSLLGIAPGLAAVTLLGSQLGELTTATNHRDVILAIIGLVVGLAILWLLKR